MCVYLFALSRGQPLWFLFVINIIHYKISLNIYSEKIIVCFIELNEYISLLKQLFVKFSIDKGRISSETLRNLNFF